MSQTFQGSSKQGVTDNSQKLLVAIDFGSQPASKSSLRINLSSFRNYLFLRCLGEYKQGESVGRHVQVYDR